MTVTRPVAVLGLTAVIAVVAAARVRSDDPVSSSVRFTGEIVRIFERRCLPCHRSDGLAIPLSTYRDVRSWGRAIREEVVEQRMPPWTVARGYGRFRNSLALSPRETTTVLSWIDGGMPRGDDRDLPTPARPAPAAAPDARVALPPQRIPALEEHVVRRVTLPIRVDSGRAVARVVLVPGARRVLRGALIFEEDATRAVWIGAWLPWQEEAVPRDPHGFRLTRGGRLVVELHYRGADRETTDESSVAIYYAGDASRPIDEVSVLPSEPARLADAATVWAIVPAAGASARSLELKARRPDGSIEVLLWAPELHREWPQALVLDRPVTLPAGTAISLVTHPADAASRVRLSLLR